MKNCFSQFFTILIAASILLSCAAKKTMLIHRNLDSARNLQKYCVTNKIQSEETQLADSIIAAANTSLKQKKDEDAYWQSDMAVAYFKIGISKKELKQSKQKLANLKKALLKEQAHLASLQEVYEEIKSLKR